MLDTSKLRRKNRKPSKRRKFQTKQRPRTTRAKKFSRKKVNVRRKKLVRSNRPRAIIDPRVARALGLMRREGLSASQAARQEGMKLKTFQKSAGRYLYRSGPGKPWKVRDDDKLRFLVRIVTDLGPRLVVARNLLERKIAGAHNSAVRMWRAGEDGAEAKLKEFEGKTVGGHRLITDTKLLTQLEEAGVLDFEDLYAPPGAES